MLSEENKKAVFYNITVFTCFYGACIIVGIFGQRLEDTVQYERKFGPRLAPLLVEQCVDFIREQGLKEEGLFRMPGQANLVKELQDAFDCGDKPVFDRRVKFKTSFYIYI